MTPADGAALIAEARAALNDLHCSGMGALFGTYRMERAIDRLASALEQAQQDTERLDWLERDCMEMRAYADGEVHLEPIIAPVLFEGHDLRAAVDAALVHYARLPDGTFTHLPYSYEDAPDTARAASPTEGRTPDEPQPEGART